jgi:hypothetical protein
MMERGRKMDGSGKTKGQVSMEERGGTREGLGGKM